MKYVKKLCICKKQNILNKIITIKMCSCIPIYNVLQQILKLRQVQKQEVVILNTYSMLATSQASFLVFHICEFT